MPVHQVLDDLVLVQIDRRQIKNRILRQVAQTQAQTVSLVVRVQRQVHVGRQQAEVGVMVVRRVQIVQLLERLQVTGCGQVVDAHAVVTERMTERMAVAQRAVQLMMGDVR